MISLMFAALFSLLPACPGADSAGYTLTQVSADGSFRCEVLA